MIMYSLKAFATSWNNISSRPKIILYLGIAIFVFSCYRNNDSIEIGQIWKLTLYEDDPHRDAEVYFQKIVGIEGDYIFYIENNGKDTLKEEMYWFVVLSERVNKGYIKHEELTDTTRTHK